MGFGLVAQMRLRSLLGLARRPPGVGRTGRVGPKTYPISVYEVKRRVTCARNYSLHTPLKIFLNLPGVVGAGRLERPIRETPWTT